MNLPGEAQGPSPEWRASFFHFTVFASTGVASAYFSIWLSNKGISADEIGVINAVPIIAMLAINVLIGRLADRASDWKHAIAILSLIAGAAPILLWFVSGFWGILLIWTMAVVPAQALVPIIDAATLRMTERRGTNFGAVRAWGSIGYTATTAISGPLIAYFGEAAFLPLFVAWSLARAALSLQLPRFRGAREAAPVEKQRARRLLDTMKPWFLLALVGLGTHWATHIIIAVFASLMWKQQGIDEGIIGPLIAISAAAEAVMMFVWRKLDIKVAARNLIILAALVGVARWGIMAFDPPVGVLFVLQLLHAVTFAMGYLGGVFFIANWTSEDIAAEAQGFSFVLQQGFSVLGLLAFGWVAARHGNLAWLLCSALSLLGAGLVFISLCLRPAAKPATEPT